MLKMTAIITQKVGVYQISIAFLESNLVMTIKLKMT